MRWCSNKDIKQAQKDIIANHPYTEEDKRLYEKFEKGRYFRLKNELLDMFSEKEVEQILEFMNEKHN